MLATLNPLGYVIKAEEIRLVLYPVSTTDVNISDKICHFFDTTREKLTPKILARYIDTCNKMQNISVGSYGTDIATKLIDSLASAKKCYCYSEPLACIELCAHHCEMLGAYLLILNQAEAIKSEVYIKSKRTGTGDVFYDILFQPVRLAILLEIGKLDSNQKDQLELVHYHRKNYFHHWEHNLHDIDNHALECLKNTSTVSVPHLELLDNIDNVRKIKSYLNIKEQ